MTVEHILGRAEAYMQVAAGKLEGGLEPKEVAAFLREKCREIDAAYKASFGATELNRVLTRQNLSNLAEA